MGKLDSLERIEPADRDEWGRWLEQNHSSSPGVMLAIGKKGGKATCLGYDAAVEEALRFGWIDSTVRKLDDDRFLQLFTPRRPGGTWAVSNKRRVEHLVADGRMMPAGIAAVDAAKSDGSWDALEDAENLVMPDDLVKALAGTPGAADAFERTVVSQRRMALFWISSAKRSETRASRIERVVKAVAEGRPPVRRG
jgi:uncharacterized protein YdeI (YjbR/CyaY-like superfamily)